MFSSISQPFMQAQANRESRAAASDAWDRSDASAREQMAFQERMSSSAHQRAREDLEKAGLNPILAANSAASAPSGAMSSGPAAEVRTIGEGLADSIGSVRALNQTIKNQQAQEKLTEAQTDKTRVEKEVLKKEIPKADIINQIYDLFKPAVQSTAKEIKNYKPVKKSLREWWSDNGTKIRGPK